MLSVSYESAQAAEVGLALRLLLVRSAFFKFSLSVSYESAQAAEVGLALRLLLVRSWWAEVGLLASASSF